MASVLSATHLRKVFRGGLRRPPVVAVDDLSLEIESGEIFGFLGLNGAGKKTSVMMLLGCVRPSAGSATIHGIPVTHPASRRRVGFLPERFRFHEFLTATELLRLHGRLSGMSASECDARVSETLEIVGLTHAASLPIRAFSKGMQQRIGLAQAIHPNPDLLILDEPTSALDPLGRREVRDILLRLKSQGRTVLLNSHLLSEVELCCDRVAIIHKGSVVRQGALSELLAPATRVEVRCDGLTPELRARIAEFATFEDVTPTRDDLFAVRVTDNDGVPRLAATLVRGGAQIHGLIPKRETLEEYFVRVVEEQGK